MNCALSPLSTLARSRHWTKFPLRATILQTREQNLFSSKETETGRFKIYQETRFNYYFLHLRLEVAFSQTQLLIRWLQFFPYMNMCRIMRLFSVQFSSREQVSGKKFWNENKYLSTYKNWATTYQKILKENVSKELHNKVFKWFYLVFFGISVHM